MKTVLLIATFSICVWPTGVFADNQTSEVSKEASRQKAAVSRPADAPGAKSKAFIHPDTGEILTRERWQALGLENDEAETVPRSFSDAPEPESTQTVLQGRQIDLGNGDYVIVVDVPESEMVETKAWFDEKGKAHIRCNH
ncbi:MAG: hypothetical protein F4Y78_04545 [Candidatus Dadabacteria bacterium]|nr:hypothetical protein [Candidatus Dadabacteria bacterium]MYA48773.1 hypothetical protein [Candidatus Dadabacteria bacterium]MYG82406.1 hypothetical protein [Candidatus Dadabacteria bacterium]MYK50042.1 hypothetical protein [Candidatus Dadabacteria bacterium]